MRYGLPTQEEVNRWDDAQRASGHEMVTIKTPCTCHSQTWEDGMLCCWLCGRTLPEKGETK